MTGASRGIGRACALALAKRGYDVAVNYVSNEAAAQAVVAEIEALGVRSLAVRSQHGRAAGGQGYVPYRRA